ncbi:L-asparaginase [bacterium]|nr:L-asparaginase [bacterium]
MSNKYVIMIHGGAGNIKEMDDEKKAKYHKSLEIILKKSSQILQEGASSLEAVTLAVKLLEDDELYNAGKGSVLNHKGEFSMDASIMDGKNLMSGAVAGISKIKNPVMLAKKVLEESEHVMLISNEAMDFAKQFDLEAKENSYFETEYRRKQFEEALKSNKVVLDHSSFDKKGIQGDEKKYGTVGAVAVDKDGNIAAATSTGGIVNKKFGRVGDSPIVGSGVYADNETAAVSSTGYGEQFIRTVIAKHLADLIAMKGLNLVDAMNESIEYLTKKVSGLGGMISVTKDYKYASNYNTPGMIHGVASSEGGINTSLEKPLNA